MTKAETDAIFKAVHDWDDAIANLRLVNSSNGGEEMRSEAAENVVKAWVALDNCMLPEMLLKDKPLKTKAPRRSST